eukprot:426873_1
MSNGCEVSNVSLKPQAKQLINQQNWTSAFNTLIQMQNLSPNNYKLKIKLGNMYEKFGNFKAAEWYYKQAIQLQSENDEGHWNLAKLYLHFAKYEMAKDSLEICLSIDKNKAATNFCMGEVLFKMNKIQSALSYYQKATEIKPYIVNYHYCVGKCALILDTFDNYIIANAHLTKCVQLTNKKVMKYINEYVTHWSKWSWKHNLFSVKETLHYLSLCGLNSRLAQKEYVCLCIYALKNGNKNCIKKLSKEYKLQCVNKALEFDKDNKTLLFEKTLLDPEKLLLDDGSLIRKKGKNARKSTQDHLTSFNAFQYLVHGFIRDIEEQFELCNIIIPDVIHQLCLLFYPNVGVLICLFNTKSQFKKRVKQIALLDTHTNINSKYGVESLQSLSYTHQKNAQFQWSTKLSNASSFCYQSNIQLPSQILKLLNN